MSAGVGSVIAVDALRVDQVVLHGDTLIAVVGSDLTTRIDLAAMK